MTYHAEIIAVGTELLLGNIANTDAQELSQALASVGVDVLYHTVVGDNPQRLEEAVAIARKRADLLIFTGGLGPTYDDLTKETVCRVLDVPLTFHPEAAADIRRNFDTIFHREMPPGTLRQAELPELRVRLVPCTTIAGHCVLPAVPAKALRTSKGSAAGILAAFCRPETQQPWTALLGSELAVQLGIR